MLVKPSEIIKRSVLALIRLQAAISKARIAAFFGCLVFLFGSPLCSQDQLLKEYIYLDGRLLAIERQSTPAIAQQPASDEDKDLNAVFAAYRLTNSNWLVMPVHTNKTHIPHAQESSRGTRQLRTNNSPMMTTDDGSPASAPWRSINYTAEIRP